MARSQKRTIEFLTVWNLANLFPLNILLLKPVQNVRAVRIVGVNRFQISK